MAVFLNASCSIAVAPVVKIESGFVRGVVNDNILEYKGIPFAAPPVGDLRWKAPQPAKHWKGVLNADTFPSQCSQLGPPLPTMPDEPTSEDCLYLNLWAPTVSNSNTKRPVMVFFYGGGFRHGSASTPLYSGGGQKPRLNWVSRMDIPD